MTKEKIDKEEEMIVQPSKAPSDDEDSFLKNIKEARADV